MKAEIIEKPAMLLVGFDFFGDPFRSYSGWSEENEIGRLCKRWMTYLQNAQPDLRHIQNPDVMYEVHVYHAETLQTGEFEVFFGLEVTQLEALPPEVVVKLLPASRYAVFTLDGQEITTDWAWILDSEWLPALGVRRRTTYIIQCYDARFKGTDAIDESELDVYIPLEN